MSAAGCSSSIIPNRFYQSPVFRCRFFSLLFFYLSILLTVSKEDKLCRSMLVLVRYRQQDNLRGYVAVMTCEGQIGFSAEVNSLGTRSYRVKGIGWAGLMQGGTPCNTPIIDRRGGAYPCTCPERNARTKNSGSAGTRNGIMSKDVTLSDVRKKEKGECVSVTGNENGEAAWKPNGGSSGPRRVTMRWGQFPFSTLFPAKSHSRLGKGHSRKWGLEMSAKIPTQHAGSEVCEAQGRWPRMRSLVTEDLDHSAMQVPFP